MALSGTIALSGSGGFTAYATWKATQSYRNNTSTISVQVLLIGHTNYFMTSVSGSHTLKVGSASTSSSADFPLRGSAVVSSLSTTIRHDENGNAKVSITASGSTPATEGFSGGGYSGSATITLNNIPQKVVLTSAPNFNDEQNPTIKYKNDLGGNITSVKACISLTGATADIAYRDISKTGTSYTFNLTDAERRVLRAATSTANRRKVKFIIQTVINGSTKYSTLEKTFSIVNALPTVSATVEDVSIETTYLTGNSSVLVKYFSDAKITIKAQAKKEATIKAVNAANDDKSIGTTVGTIYNVESPTFVLSATDSRGNAASNSITAPFIEYRKLSCNIGTQAPSAAGNSTLTISGNYFNGTFGAHDNTLILHYRHKEEGGEWGEWQNVSGASFGSNETYELTINLSGLDYKKQHTFQARAADMLMTVDSAERSVKTVPIFDWGQHDFNFNVPVNFSESNKVLWSGGMYMMESHTAKLSEPISKQMSGIILVFSFYNEGAAQNYDWHSFFVPKTLIALQNGTGHTFNMNSQAYGYVGSKYLYIYDDSIKGHSANTSTNTTNGITFNNKAYVLRYVIGV